MRTLAVAVLTALSSVTWAQAPAAPASSPGPAPITRPRPGNGAQPAAPSPYSGSSRGAERDAREFYAIGRERFDAGDKDGALIEFQKAYELAPRPLILFMIANCEYHLGQFKQARSHYEEFLAHETEGAYPETARQRIESIKRRRAVLVIQAAPLGVDVTIERLDQPGETVTGQAPNQFAVPAGRWRVTARAPSYIPQSVEVTLDSTDTKPLFFPLERQPARLEISTIPEHATLYVRGNRARNPFVQDVAPGAYEVYAEAPSYESRTETFVVEPGAPRKIRFPLRYVQRSGRPELIGFWTGAGALAGGGLVLARLSDPTDSVPASAAVVGGAALVGGVIGALGATAWVPDQLPDNRALFRIGAAWIGAAEGATIASAIKPTLSSAWLGGAVGLGTGAIAGTWLDEQAPNYGRVAMIQSGAAAGLLAGALAMPALGIEGTERRSLALIGGLNLGLGAGLALALLPDQKEYGPTWQRVMLIDLAIGAGTLAGALIRVVSRCLQPSSGSTPLCTFSQDEGDRRLTARFALAGGLIGFVSGVLLTKGYDRESKPPLDTTARSFLPMPTLLPVTSPDGGTAMVPGLLSHGRF